MDETCKDRLHERTGEQTNYEDETKRKEKQREAPGEGSRQAGGKKFI